MTNSDRERVIVFKRLLTENNNLSALTKLKDDILLELLNSTIIPNSKSNNILYFTYTFNKIFNPSKQDKINRIKKVTNIDEMIEAMCKTEKDILRFGLNKGYDSNNKEYQLTRYINESSLIEKGDFSLPKMTPQKMFSKVFPFIFNLIKKGENNGRYPRL